jgi:hypothetical protein
MVFEYPILGGSWTYTNFGKPLAGVTDSTPSTVMRRTLYCVCVCVCVCVCARTHARATESQCYSKMHERFAKRPASQRKYVYTTQGIKLRSSGNTRGPVPHAKLRRETDRYPMMLSVDGLSSDQPGKRYVHCLISTPIITPTMHYNAVSPMRHQPSRCKMLLLK